MIFKCIEFPGSEFATKEDMFKALKANEDKLISLKKAHIYKSCDKHQVSFLNVDMAKVSATVKANFEIKEGYIYPVISTTRYCDSHKDVHFDNCFNRTVKHQQGKVYYALDHELKWNSILAWQKDVRMFVTPLDWSLVGKSYAGQTEALVFEIAESKITKADVLAAIKSRSSDFENSIRMSYDKITLGVNSTDRDMADNKAYFDKNINLIANQADVMEQGYFWGVEELSISKEGSLVVAGGSNDATSIITMEPAKSTSEIMDSLKDTPRKSFYSLFN